MATPARFTNEMLCSLCRPIFSGHWASFDETKQRGLDFHPSLEGWGTVEYLVRIPRSSEQQYSPLMSLQHHSITSLRESAQRCPLCCMLLAGYLFERRENRMEEMGVGFVTIDTRRRGGPGPSVHYFSQLDDGSWEFLKTSLSLNIEWRFNELLLPPFTKGCPRIALQDWTAPAINDSLKRVKSWLASQSPSVSSPTKLPTRLLRVEPRAGSPSVRLVNIKGSTVGNAPYATLSHRWGDHQPICLQTDNFESFIQQIPFESLPRTFKDAVQVTLEIGLSWLWIDSLTIIQDSEDDWLSEAEKMHTVYSQAYVNLAATSSLDSTGGLFPKDEVLRQPCILQTTWTGLQSGVILVYDPYSFTHQVDNSPLNARGWVFQERVLASRTVHFTQHQIWWTTNHSLEVYVDSFPTSISLLVSRSHQGSRYRERKMLPHVLWRPPDGLRSKENPFETWKEYVRGYSRTNLTKPSDKLVALAGIASMFAETYDLQGTDYLAGLWRQNLGIDLLWCLVKGRSRGRPGQYRAPSWSWASTDGEVWWHYHAAIDDTFPVAKVLQANVCTVKGPFGPVKQGFLVIKGPLVRVNFLCHEDGLVSPDLKRLAADVFHAKFNFTILSVDPDDSDDFIQQSKNPSYLGVLIEVERYQRRGSGLILSRTCERGEFMRVGLVDEIRPEIYEAWRNSMSVCHHRLDESEYLQHDAESGFYTYRIV